MSKVYSYTGDKYKVVVPGHRFEKQRMDDKLTLWEKGSTIIEQQYPLIAYAVLQAKHVNTKGEPLSFKKSKYLIDIYKNFDDTHQVFKKSTQCGISEYAISNILYHAEKGLQILYVLPVESHRNDFVANRIDKLFANVSHYAKMIKQAGRQNANTSGKTKDSVGMKFFGKGTLKFVASKSEKGFVEYPADMYVIDELDLCNQSNVRLGFHRLDSSNYRKVIEISNPTLPNIGIDVSYNRSTGGVWHIKCDSCGQWQRLDWFLHVVRQIDDENYELIDSKWDIDSGRDINVYCQFCHKPIADNVRYEHGEWVHEYPNRDIKGYHIHKLMSARTRIDYLYGEFVRGLSSIVNMKSFMNNDLGVAYDAKGAKVSSDILELNEWNYKLKKSSEMPTVCGVDVGNKLHCIIRERDSAKAIGIIELGGSDKFKHLEGLIKQYSIQLMIIDMKPETSEVKRLISKFRGVVFACDYVSFDSPRTQFDKKKGLFKTDRTFSLDNLMTQFRLGKRPLPRDWRNFDGGTYHNHLTVSTRYLNEDIGEYVWENGSKDDHYHHAENYCNIALERVEKKQEMIDAIRNKQKQRNY